MSGSGFERWEWDYCKQYCGDDLDQEFPQPLEDEAQSVGER
jgi:hypothetical protein